MLLLFLTIFRVNFDQYIEWKMTSVSGLFIGSVMHLLLFLIPPLTKFCVYSLFCSLALLQCESQILGIGSRFGGFCFMHFFPLTQKVPSAYKRQKWAKLSLFIFNVSVVHWGREELNVLTAVFIYLFCFQCWKKFQILVPPNHWTVVSSVPLCSFDYFLFVCFLKQGFSV